MFLLSRGCYLPCVMTRFQTLWHVIISLELLSSALDGISFSLSDSGKPKVGAGAVGGAAMSAQVGFS